MSRPFSRPRRRRCGPADRAAGACIDSADSDLPQPDSPTSATVSPAPTERLRPSTAFISPRAREERGAEVADFEGAAGRAVIAQRSRSLGLSASFSPSPTRLRQSTVIMMAMPGMAQMYQELRMSCAPVADQPAPARDVGIAEAEEGDAPIRTGWRRPRPATTARSPAAGRWAGSRETMIWKSLMPMERQACTNSRSRSDRNSARVMRAIGVQLTMPMAITMLVERRAQDDHDGEHEDQVRDGLEQFGDAHADLVDPAAEVAGGGTDADPDDRGDRRGEQADQQGRPRAVHDHREDVAAQRIGAQRKLGVLARPRFRQPTMRSGSSGRRPRRRPPSGRRPGSSRRRPGRRDCGRSGRETRKAKLHQRISIRGSSHM